MRSTSAKKADDEFALGAKETLLMTLRPHPVSFVRYYSVGIVLLIWVVLLYWMHAEDMLSFDFLGDEMNDFFPGLFMALGAVIVGLWLVDDFKWGFRFIYWFAVIALLVVAGLYIWYWKNPDFAYTFTMLYGIAMGIMGILFAELFRRAFTYMVTNQRIVIQYKFLSIEETNMRFEKIEDFEIVRPLSFRMVGLGIIRPYTGTEDAKTDNNRDFHGPHEALYGVRRPNDVKRQLIEIILERDQWDKQVVDLLEEQKTAQKKAPAPAPGPEPEPEPAAPAVAYYQPAPEPEPEPEPAPTRNYERIEPTQYAPEPPDDGVPPPAPPEEEEPEPQPSPVRTMYPEAKDTGTPLEMEDTKSMAFDRGDRPPDEPTDYEPPTDDEDWKRRDGSKPRKL
jgi:hypothetical protein